MHFLPRSGSVVGSAEHLRPGPARPGRLIKHRDLAKKRSNIWDRLEDSWGSPGGLLGASWGLPGVSWEAPWRLPGRFLGVSWACPGRFLGVFWGFLGSLGGFLRVACMHPGGLLGASGVLSWRPLGVYSLVGVSWSILGLPRAFLASPSRGAHQPEVFIFLFV